MEFDDDEHGIGVVEHDEMEDARQELDDRPYPTGTSSAAASSMDNSDPDETGVEICRVCRMEETSDRPMYYPCLCTGSIKYIHQECLVQWLKYSKKEFCELCNYKYSFQPIYRTDMPKRLPVTDVVKGIMSNILVGFKFWLLYTVVLTSWLGVVPLTASRIYRVIFSGSFTSLITFPLELISTEHVVTDVVHGCFIVSLFLLTFICLFWLREQIVHGGPAHLLHINPDNIADNPEPQDEVAAAVQQMEDEAAAAGGDEDDAAEAVVEGDHGDAAQPPAAVGAEAAEPAVGAEAAAHEHVQDDAAPAAGAPPAGGGAQQNWLEWGGDRAEDLTWERLLGLDGSLVFIEHIFWVISLNTFFTFVFAFSPYHLGRLGAQAFKLGPYLAATKFEGVTTALFGYLLLCFGVYVGHNVGWLFNLRRFYRASGMAYLVLKVFLLVLMEIGLFPLLSGWWLDICSMALFSSTLPARLTAFSANPGTSAFIHWLVGMVYVFYFASFVLVLREVLRPGVLWFLRNLNDPEFNPIQEMIQLPLFRHVRRVLASIVLFSVSIMLVIFIPIRILLVVAPAILPYNISLTSETPLSELSLELLLLQVVLPALLEQSQARTAVKHLIRGWCRLMGRMLDVTDYLLPAADVAPPPADVEPPNVVPPQEDNAAADEAAANEAAAPLIVEPPAAAPLIVEPPAAAPAANAPLGGGHLAAEHQALLLAREPVGFQPYRRPSWFPLRILALLACLAATTVVCSVICLSVPVVVGRLVIGWATGHSKAHELYTISCGLYCCWIVLRTAFLLSEWVAAGYRALTEQCKQWMTMGGKLALAGAAAIIVIPLFVGTCFQLMVITPLRVEKNQSPIYFPWQDWAMGILHCKIACAVITMGPDWWLKEAFERIYQDGFRNLNLAYFYRQLVMPVVSTVGLIITVPYLLAHATQPLIGATDEERILFIRYIYPCMLILTAVTSFVYWQCRKLKGFVAKIRNEKYLVGQRLVNYERIPAEDQRQNNIHT